MTGLDKMARELLAAEYSKIGNTPRAEDIRNDRVNSDEHLAIKAIHAALLTAPPGWKLVPVEPSDDQLVWMDGHDEASQRRAYANLLAASPRATQP